MAISLKLLKKIGKNLFDIPSGWRVYNLLYETLGYYEYAPALREHICFLSTLQRGEIIKSFSGNPYQGGNVFQLATYVGRCAGSGI